ncbi:MAG: hypothetical protein H0T42_06370 [Deltaproteobacteria bacterium]|nr:hypothetical protein [Deltaproteobacteria bacterium]
MRQVIRNSQEIDACMHDQPKIEVRVLIRIEKRGLPTLVSVQTPLVPRARTCIVDALWGWEFASAPQAGELLVVYQPGR